MSAGRGNQSDCCEKNQPSNIPNAGGKRHRNPSGEVLEASATLTVSPVSASPSCQPDVWGLGIILLQLGLQSMLWVGR